MRRKQNGSFTVELAIILVFVSMAFHFQINNSIAISTKGKLDRLSYSLVNILSERRQLFNDEGDMCSDRRKCSAVLDDMLDIAKASLGRTSGEFNPDKLGIRIEELRKEKSNKFYTVRTAGSLDGCNLPSIQNNTSLLPKTSRNRHLPMYQVTLCYETPFNVTGIADGNLMRVVSSSFTYARI
ncbi:tight adherence pilus pseudopilin TadF [uncultured Photobacterium sp.]|uniref:tight adherence pilus pseudopilin TadF n=1 Tax=uncultured Photobacterium sp. TaxID=173973 RepID=UPI00260701A8|nr:tight adherence pilus pseudopilin TadF [uncultured Photobacterium sp.]